MNFEITSIEGTVIKSRDKDCHVGGFSSKKLKNAIGMLAGLLIKKGEIPYSVENNIVTTNSANAASQLNITTPPSGGGQPIHPKVLFMPNKFGGHYFWMAYTPYPNANDGLENPCIACSDDLVNWNTPDGATNPLDEDPKYDGSNYNSDTHLLYREDTGVLEVWFRYCNTKANTEIIYRMCSNDGVKWSEKEAIFTSVGNTESYPFAHLLSPVAIWDDDEKLYRIWAIDKNNSFAAVYFESKDGRDWEKKGITNLIGWHFDVIKTADGYEAILSDTQYGATISHATSSDGLTWSAKTKIMEAGPSGSWDSSRLYRPCMVKEGGKYYVFYTGTHDNVWHIGLSVSTDSNDITSIKGYVGGNVKIICNFSEMLYE